MLRLAGHGVVNNKAVAHIRGRRLSSRDTTLAQGAALPPPPDVCVLADDRPLAIQVICQVWR